MVGGEGAVSFLFTIGSHESVNSFDLDFVKFLAGLLDNGLLGTSVDNEDEGVVVFNGLDSAFGADGVLNNGVRVEYNGG